MPLAAGAALATAGEVKEIAVAYGHLETVRAGESGEHLPVGLSRLTDEGRKPCSVAATSPICSPAPARPWSAMSEAVICDSSPFVAPEERVRLVVSPDHGERAAGVVLGLQRGDLGGDQRCRWRRRERPGR